MVVVPGVQLANVAGDMFQTLCPVSLYNDGTKGLDGQPGAWTGKVVVSTASSIHSSGFSADFLPSAAPNDGVGLIPYVRTVDSLSYSTYSS